MKGKYFIGLGIIVAIFLGIGALNVQSQTNSPTGIVEVQASIDTVFTYQGYLADNGADASGDYDFEFALYTTEDIGTGTQVGDTNPIPDLSLADGVFTTQLDFGASAFTGEAQYLEIRVRPGASTGSYETLDPRQLLTAVPYAHGLIPGAIVSGNVTSGMLTLNNATGDGLDIPTAGGNGVYVGNVSGNGMYVGNAAIDGVRVYRAASDGIDITTADENGVYVTNAGGDGVKINRAEGTGFTILSASGNGLFVNDVGGDGVLINQASDDGVDINFASGDGIAVNGAGRHGLYVGSVGGNGMYVQNATANGIEVTNTGGNGMYIGNAAIAGVRVYQATTGIDITNTSGDGMYITKAGTNGVRINGANGAGVRVERAEGDGIYVGSAGGRAGYFGGAVEVNGTTTTKILAITGGSDIAERFDISANDKQTPEPGMVVCIDPANPGALIVCNNAYDFTVAGAVSGAGGVNPGMVMGQNGSIADGEYPVALTGRVYVMVDASYGAIQPGDLLTTSNTPGHAMVVTDYDQAQGAILGKAMTALDSGTGLVLVLVTLQ